MVLRGELALCRGGRRFERGYERQLALQICEHLSQSVADSNLLFVNEFVCTDRWRAHRRGDSVLRAQVILAVRGRDRICRGSGACTASSSRTIRAPVADDCAAAGY